MRKASSRISAPFTLAASNGGHVYPADLVGSLLPADSYSPIPTHPSGADVDANMKEAAEMYPDPFAFRSAVNDRGRWD